MENENKVDEATNPSVDENNEENTGNEPDLATELEKERQARQQLTARAKRAEEELKQLKEKAEKSQETKPEVQSASPDVDERILKANGMPDDLLKELKAVAQVRGVGLIEAQNDPVFTAIKSDYEKETKAKEASLGSSKGSGQAKAKVDFKTPGLTRAEHKELFKQKFK